MLKPTTLQETTIERIARERISEQRLVCNTRMPYMRATTNGLIPRAVPGLGTVATTQSMLYLYDPEFLFKITDPLMLGGVMFHENLHHLKQHRKRAEALGLKTPEQLQRWNVAGDMENNRDVLAAGLTLPGPDILGGEFETAQRHGFPGNLLAEQYYDLLEKEDDQKKKEAKERGDKGPPADGKGAADDGASEGAESTPADGKGPSRVARGCCGGAAGNACAGEPEGGAENGADGGRSEAESAAIRDQTVRAIQEAVKSKGIGKGVGCVSSDLARWVEKANEKIPIPWWILLQRTWKHAVTFASGKSDLTFKGPSRRQGGVGYGPGRPVMPSLHKPVPKVWVGVDTSGSMSEADVSAVLTVIDDISKLRVPVTFFTCDTEVRGLVPVSSWRDAAKWIVGGGGTDFNPIFQKVLELPASKRPAVIAFVTDGCGPAPKDPPPGLKVIFIYVGSYHSRPYCEGGAIQWGEHVTVGAKVRTP